MCMLGDCHPSSIMRECLTILARPRGVEPLTPRSVVREGSVPRRAIYVVTWEFTCISCLPSDLMIAINRHADP
jgi:hypothetical protein